MMNVFVLVHKFGSVNSEDQINVFMKKSQCFVLIKKHYEKQIKETRNLSHISSYKAIISLIDHEEYDLVLDFLINSFGLKILLKEAPIEGHILS